MFNFFFFFAVSLLQTFLEANSVSIAQEISKNFPQSSSYWTPYQHLAHQYLLNPKIVSSGNFLSHLFDLEQFNFLFHYDWLCGRKNWENSGKIPQNFWTVLEFYLAQTFLTLSQPRKSFEIFMNAGKILGNFFFFLHEKNTQIFFARNF
jgi:hypothetical protein